MREIYLIDENGKFKGLFFTAEAVAKQYVKVKNYKKNQPYNYSAYYVLNTTEKLLSADETISKTDLAKEIYALSNKNIIKVDLKHSTVYLSLKQLEEIFDNASKVPFHTTFCLNPLNEVDKVYLKVSKDEIKILKQAYINTHKIILFFENKLKKLDKQTSKTF